MCDYIKYKGFWIYKNESPEFGTSYYSVVNPRLKDHEGKLIHAHGNSRKQVRQIADCCQKILHGGKYWKYGRVVRNKALRLSGTKVMMN